jgi:hypothetical protein
VLKLRMFPITVHSLLLPLKHPGKQLLRYSTKISSALRSNTINYPSFLNGLLSLLFFCFIFSSWAGAAE